MGQVVIELLIKTLFCMLRSLTQEHSLPFKILMPFLHFSCNLFQDTHVAFTKSVDNYKKKNAQFWLVMQFHHEEYITQFYFIIYVFIADN